MSKVEFDCGKWLQEAEEFALPNWSALPSIPLYMDQVMMFTGEALSLFERDEKQSLLTNSMINNYVKSGVLPPPKNKKYNRTHLAILMIVCAMKPVMEISAVSDIIKRSIAAGSIEDVLDEFARMYENELSSSIKKANIAVEASHNDEILSYIAIENTLKASAARTVAMHAYNSIQTDTQMDKKKEPAPQKKTVSPAKGKKKESSEEEISESTENSDDTHEEND